MTQQPPNLIARLRRLRTDGLRLRATLVEDLMAFQKKDFSFFTLPDSKRAGISVATTCTALMAVIDSDKSLVLFRKPTEDTDKAKQRAKKLFSSVVRTSWISSGLEDLNAFTTAMVVRAAGFLVKAGILTLEEAEDLKHERPNKKMDSRKTRHKIARGAIETALSSKKKPRLLEVITAVAREVPDSFMIPRYPPKTAMAYWFVDGVSKANFNLSPGRWKKIANWAADQFNRELTYVVSGNDALMDPASLAMAACLVSRIRKICAEKRALADINEKLPSMVEVMHAVLQVFEKQTDSGIWHRHFPLFHFPGSGAADYCFSFEFLEAILIEFSESNILQNQRILERILNAVRWCENNRLESGAGEDKYQGWNAGGDVSNLVAGKPESWATATVHMFLAELDSSISELLDKLILTRFRQDREVISRSEDSWKKLIDVNLIFPGEKSTTLKKVIERELLSPELPKLDAKILRERPLTGARSALLFGPPGTSKTSIAKAVAEWLGWPLLVLTPSEFLSNGLEQIYVRVHELFEDLMDLSAAVILFDEMDALAQTRGNVQLDVTRELLTTSMLPKLANLWNQRRVIFFMATNHKQQLDPAITRPGRFDLLLCVGPPPWAKKLAGLPVVLEPVTDELRSIQRALKSISKSTCTEEQLDAFTVAELRSLLNHLRRRDRSGDLLTALSKLDAEEFETLVAEWATTTIALSRGSALAQEYKDDLGASRRQ